MEDAMRSVDLAIRIHGWHLTLVEASMPWCYTIGLMETHGHPELVVVDLKRDAAVELTRWAASIIERDGRLGEAMLERRQVEAVTVHDQQLTGDRFAMWANHYETMPPSGAFLQLIPPPDWFCGLHQNTTSRLDQADGAPVANRATRRHRGKAA